MDGGRILLVEDDEDTRQLLALALGARGFEVDQSSDAHGALRCLRARRYALVLTDYDLPGRTGAAMLRDAAAEGLLEGAATLIVTAHPEPQGVGATDVARKPLDLGAFLVQVERILEKAGPAVRPAGGATPAAGPASPPPPVVELRLYVSGRSAVSLRARRAAETLLTRYPRHRVTLAVRDVARDAGAAAADRIVFTPTLVKVVPAPPVWVVGDLDDPALVRDLLEGCGVEPIA